MRAITMKNPKVGDTVWVSSRGRHGLGKRPHRGEGIIVRVGITVSVKMIDSGQIAELDRDEISYRETDD